MNKIFLVIRREYLTRVKKKSFIIMTILGPLLLTLLWGGIIFFAVNQDVGGKTTQVHVIDGTGKFQNRLTSNKSVAFSYGGSQLDSVQLKEMLDSSVTDAVLFIPASLDRRNPKGIELVSLQSPSIYVKGYIEQQIGKQLEEENLKALNITQATIDSIKADVSLITRKPNKEVNATGAATFAGFAGAFLIYLFIFLYGAMVMRGVLEEKTNRIVEVVLSSVRPFQLMMGKIIGVAMVGLTQFLIWVVLSGALISVLSAVAGNQISAEAAQEAAGQFGKGMQQAGEGGQELNAILGQVFALPWATILTMFVFYFISGYLFYSSLFAAIGSAVDSETETQQFMLPITIPLIFALVIAQSAVVQNPHGPLALWLSMIPFTSPVVMMVRIPFDVPVYELVLSVLSMVAGFLFTAWLAARIYRVGILMYGKKASYKELFKWIFYKE